ncbi:hypothetical protein chiPu_0028860, partial [Chiloscyllium punctatum]|nr:hypothetical protein [Chiloscyllium punctatum]
ATAPHAIRIARRRTGREGPARLKAGRSSGLDVGRQLAAIGGELGHHLLMQPDIHGGGVVGIAGVVQLLRELLARRKARVEAERLHQVDDRGAPVELLAGGRRRLVDDRSDIDRLRRRRPWRRRGGSWRC